MSKPSVEQSYRTLTLLWFALLSSQIMFLFIIYFTKPEVYRVDLSRSLFEGPGAGLVVGLGVLAVVNVALSFVIKRRCYQQAIAEQQISYVQTGLIIACALCEANSLIAMVLVFAFSYQYFFLWIALGIIGILLHFPRRGDVIAASYKK